VSRGKTANYRGYIAQQYELVRNKSDQVITHLSVLDFAIGVWQTEAVKPLTHVLKNSANQIASRPSAPSPAAAIIMQISERFQRLANNEIWPLREELHAKYETMGEFPDDVTSAVNKIRQWSSEIGEMAQSIAELSDWHPNERETMMLIARMLADLRDDMVEVLAILDAVGPRNRVR